MSLERISPMRSHEVPKKGQRSAKQRFVQNSFQFMKNIPPTIIRSWSLLWVLSLQTLACLHFIYVQQFFDSERVVEMDQWQGFNSMFYLIHP